ncbi:LysR family transcriptional regulator [Vibrio cyclitrophicus]
MNIARIDLNLLVYLDMLLRERNVTRAANQLGITQPAMSNGLSLVRKTVNVCFVLWRVIMLNRPSFNHC